MLNFPRLFSFSLRFFQRTTPPIDRFLEEVHQTPMATAQTRSQEKLHPTDIPTQKQTTTRPVDAGFAHSRPPNLRVSPQPPPFRSRTKKQLPIFRWIAV